ncbi:protein-export chaperone SecB [Thioclava nitratireducens]|uniref:protein-export chaperone SecB n=1 Tax=Thioclava nitratireducens TaxID=1915078 RepID=UPI002481290C|nr:protein-export chaperone SecB [Thioclava nitratireducens]WGT51924.1 protein-export chaperone SecB [Thioclava nitratireducens]
MTDEANGETNDAADPQQEQQGLRMNILAQFTRDLSFENNVATKGVQTSDIQPEMQVQVSLDAKKRSVENQYEVITKFKITANNKSDGATLYLLELDYGGIFHVEGVPEDQLHPFLLIECPRQLFPFVRRIVSDVTRDGGFPPFNLEIVDFVALYRNELARRQQTEAPTTA